MLKRYLLASSDETLLLSCDEREPLVAEAKAIVKSGDYSVTQLGIYELKHQFYLPAQPELVLTGIQVPPTGSPVRTGSTSSTRRKK